MPHLLHIDTSARGEGSTTRELTALFRSGWTAAHPDGTVTYRDLATDPVPYPDTPDLATAGLSAREAPEARRASHELTDQLIRELEDADTYVLGVPMYNFMVPAVLKSWVDRIVAPGRTFDTETRAGSLVGKDVTIITARGGSYAPGSPRAAFDFQEPWLRAALGQVGLADIRFVHAELTLAHTMPKLARFQPVAVASYTSAVHRIRALHEQVEPAG